MAVALRVVLDTNVLISTVLFRSNRMKPLRDAWHDGTIIPLVSKPTSEEFLSVVRYQKFKLTLSDIEQVLSLYMPYVEPVSLDWWSNQTTQMPQTPQCRDSKDQMFIDLAHYAKADYLISGDQDVLALQGQTSFQIQTPAVFIQETLNLHF